MNKKIYNSPILDIIELDDDIDFCKLSWSHPHEHHPNKHDHCGNCKWDNNNEYWHCDHSINNWTGEPFYPDCDFYIK